MEQVTYEIVGIIVQFAAFSGTLIFLDYFRKWWVKQSSQEVSRDD